MSVHVTVTFLLRNAMLASGFKCARGLSVLRLINSRVCCNPVATVHARMASDAKRPKHANQLMDYAKSKKVS